jgi:ABC-type transport system involved in multi-copper enzyme maturation permease subunit
MATLFRYELKKLLNRKLTWLMLAIGMLPSSAYAQGMRDVYAKYEGRVLTDALSDEANADKESFIAAHEAEFETFEDDEISALYYAGQSDYNRGVWQAYELVTQSATWEQYLEKAARYQGYLDAGCYENGKPLTREDRSRLESDIVFLSTAPPVVHYAEGWKYLSLCNQFLGFFPLFLLALCMAPLFSGERAAKMEGVLLCAAKRRQLGMAKLLAASVLTLIIFVLLYGMQLLAVGLTYGLDGAAVSDNYYSWLGLSFVRTQLGLFAGGALVALAAMLALAFITALFSAAFRNTLIAMLAYAGAVAAQFVLMSVVNSEVWHSLKGPAWKTVSDIVYLLPGNALFDVSRSLQIDMILYDLGYVAVGLLLSLGAAAAAAAFAKGLYFKRRKV